MDKLGSMFGTLGGASIGKVKVNKPDETTEIVPLKSPS